MPKRKTKSIVVVTTKDAKPYDGGKSQLGKLLSKPRIIGGSKKRIKRPPLESAINFWNDEQPKQRTVLKMIDRPSVLSSAFETNRRKH